MEVKLSQRPVLRLPLFQSKSKLPSHSLCLKSWPKGGKFFQKHLRAPLQEWRSRIQEMLGQCSVENYLVHVVKEGETLTSISKQYGVSMYAIAAANKSIVDIDLVFEGQHLNIPSGAKKIQVSQSIWSATFNLPKMDQSSLNILNEVLDPKNLSMLYSRFVPNGCPSYYQARTIGCFLVLVPLIAFCIRCIMAAFRSRVAQEFRQKAVNESDVKHHRSKGKRWKSALGDAWEPDMNNSESMSDSSNQNHSEDDTQISYEEASHAYRKLEHDYQEFLSQCGMSKWGYWRGGSQR